MHTQGRPHSMQGFIIECLLLQTEPEGVKEIPAAVREILEELDDVFQNPQGLPHKRRHDHAIVLKEGAAIPNLWPYRYPHFQKNEIEELC